LERGTGILPVGLVEKDKNKEENKGGQETGGFYDTPYFVFLL
jgi:hypothetical protein